MTYDPFGQSGPTTEVLIDAVGYLVAGGAETGTPGAAGTTGAKGAMGPTGGTGPTGAQGVAGPMTSSCSATLGWGRPSCRAATVNDSDLNGPEGVAFDDTNIWVANNGSNTGSYAVSKIVPF